MISFVEIENMIFFLVETINTYNGVSYGYFRETRVFTFCSAILLRKCKNLAKIDMTIRKT